MRRHTLQALLLIATIVFCHSFAVSSVTGKKTKGKKQQESIQRTTLTAEQDSIFGELFFEAMRLREAGKADSAQMFVDSCLKVNPQSAVALFLRASYYSEQDSLALQDLEAAAALEPTNDIYQEDLAQQYIGTANFDKAIDAYEKLYATHRDRDDVLALLIRLYSTQKNYDMMLDAINRLEQVDGENDQLSMMRMNVYETMGDTVNAYATLKGLADSHPNDANFKLMLGNWLVNHKRTGEAFGIYQTVLAEEPDNPMAQSSMYDYYKAVGEDSLAQGMMTRLLLGKETPAETRQQFMRIAIRNNEKAGGDSTEIIALIGKMQQVLPNDTVLAQTKAAYYSMKKLPEDSVNNALYELLALQPDNAAARVQLIQNKWGDDNLQEIAQLSEPGMLYNPDEMVFYYFTGLTRYYLKNEDGALDAMRKGTTEINSESNADLVGEMYAIMGEIYHNKGMADEAYAAYDSCLQYKPGNVMTLNNYAYYLSLDNKNLEKAEQMSAKAVAAEPKNATYLDTYAWVLYKLGRYAEAKVYIDQTLQFTTDSTSDHTLYEHAAEIYANLGDYSSAAAFCDEAIKHGGDAKALTAKANAYRKKKK